MGQKIITRHAKILEKCFNSDVTIPKNGTRKIKAIPDYFKIHSMLKCAAHLTIEPYEPFPWSAINGEQNPFDEDISDEFAISSEIYLVNGCCSDVTEAALYECHLNTFNYYAKK